MPVSPSLKLTAATRFLKRRGHKVLSTDTGLAIHYSSGAVVPKKARDVVRVARKLLEKERMKGQD